MVLEGPVDVRFESKATFRSAIVMSALPPKANMCGATRDVRFGPIADITLPHSPTWAARSSDDRKSKPLIGQ